MKYYYIERSQNSYDILGSSKLNINNQNTNLLPMLKKDDALWDYNETIKLSVYAQAGARKLSFIKYIQNTTYNVIMIPELKEVLEKFNMPEHRWYKAEAGYYLKFVKDMKDFFNIDYDIDINEKRLYWILQFLDTKLEELAFEKIDFKLMDYDTFKPVDNEIYIKKGEIINYQQYKEARKKEVEEKNCFIKPFVYKYAKNYDILWAGIYIVFNEKVKEALEATHIITAENGLEFVEFTDYEIEMLGE